MSPAEQWARLHARNIEQERKAIRDYLPMLALLKRAAGSLQDYCAEVNGDMNDSSAMEIEAYLRG